MSLDIQKCLEQMEAKYAVFSEPNWSELNLAGTPENFVKLKTFDCTSQYNVHPHFLYKLCR